MSSFDSDRSQTQVGDKQNDDTKVTVPSAGKEHTSDAGGAPKIDSNTRRKKDSKARFTKLERDLIAKQKSKTETKLGKFEFRLGRTAKHGEQVSKPSNLPKTSTQILTGQKSSSPAPRQQKSLQQKSQILTHGQATQIPKTQTIRPQLSPSRTARHAAGQGKKSLPKTSTMQISHQQRKSTIPSQPQQKSQIPPQLPLRRKTQSPPPQTKTQKVAPQQQRSTQEQKSLAEQRRREARNETPITMAEVDMNEKEINESKNLVMCFLSGIGEDESLEETAVGRSRVWNDASSSYVDGFQHDPNNRSMAYHYRAPPSRKKAKSSIES